jgi:antitoxin component YwqK of YwqJK toxin-antitoxin module
MPFPNKYRTVILSIFLASAIFGAACKTPKTKIVARFRDSTKAMVFYYPDRNDTTSFVSTEYYRNGHISKLDTVQNGYIVGTAKAYFPDGKIYHLVHFADHTKAFNDHWDGTVTQYYENGERSGEFIVKNGLLEGLSKYYNGKGILVKEYGLTKDSIKTGAYREFFDNGRVSLERNYQNGQAVGYEYMFTERGDTDRYYAMSEGHWSMPSKRWLTNGQILEGNFYDSSGKIVIWKWLTRDGKELKRSIKYSVNKKFVSPEPN